MILAYPYFRRGNTFYYLYKQKENQISILTYNASTEEFENIFHRTVKDGKFVMYYRPVRTTFYMKDLIPVEE